MTTNVTLLELFDWFDVCFDEICKLAGYNPSKMRPETKKKFLDANKYFFDLLREQTQRDCGDFDIVAFFRIYRSHLTLV